MGTIDLDTGVVREARREDYLTQISGCKLAPKGTPHPLWSGFLDRVMAGDEELIKYLQRVCGYSMTGYTNEHAFFFLYGTGRNGKGVFANTIRMIFGDYAEVASIQTFLASKSDRHLTELAKLRAKRLVLAQETPQGREWDEEKIKLVTGGDAIAARFMRQDEFTFVPMFKLWVIGNNKPRLGNVDEAMKARLQLIPFMVTIPEAERDKDLMEKLKVEWPAILRWVLDGCLEWQRIGLAPPPAVRNATTEYFVSQDHFSLWLEEACELDLQDQNRKTSNAALYASWVDYCRNSGNEPGTKDWLIEKLQGIGCKRTTIGKAKVRGYTGIRLQAPISAEDAEKLQAQAAAAMQKMHRKGSASRVKPSAQRVVLGYRF